MATVGESADGQNVCIWDSLGASEDAKVALLWKSMFVEGKVEILLDLGLWVQMPRWWRDSCMPHRVLKFARHWVINFF